MNRRFGVADVLVWLLAGIAAPAAFFCFSLNRFSWNHEWFALTLAIATAAIAILIGRAPLAPASRTLRLIAIGGACMVIAVVLWNVAYNAHISSPGADTSRGEFRAIRNSRHWPVYGAYHFDGFARAIPVILSMALMIAFLLREDHRGGQIDSRFLLRLALLQFITMLAFAYSENRLTVPVEYAGFRVRLAQFDKGGIPTFLRRYVRVQPKLGTFDPHYPPGFSLLMIVERETHLYGLVAEIVFLLVPLTLLVLNQLAGEIGGDANARRWTLGLFATAAGVLIFPTITPTTGLVFSTSLICLLLIRTLRQNTVHRAVVAGVSLGIAVAVHAFFSFNIGMLSVLLGLIVVIAAIANVNGIRANPRSTIIALACAIATFAVIYFAVYETTGFNWWASMRVARRTLTLSNGKYRDSLVRFLLRATGNPLAYLLSCGFVLTIPLLAAPVKKISSLGDVIALAAPLALIAASVLGLGRFETERVWLFFTPIICIAAARWFAERDRGRALFNLTMICAALWACAQELLYHHY